MKRLLRQITYGFTLLATVSTMGLLRAGAQAPTTLPSNGFRISPVRSELTIEKGKNTTLTITLENPSEATTTGHAIVNDFVAADDETGEPRLILDENSPLPKNDFKKLVSQIPDVTLGPRQKKDIVVSVSVPADANSGGYYGAIRFVPTQLVNDKNVGLTASVGTIVLVRVPGNLTERLDLVQISAASKSKKNGADVYTAKRFFTGGDVALLTRLKNSGDIHLQPFGKILLKDTFGKTVQDIEFNNTDPRANILPDSVRKFTNDLNKRRWFGRYTIEANLGYSQGGGDLISTRATFWYIPTIAIWAMLGGVVAIVGFIYWLIRKNKARKQHKHDVNKQKI